MGIRDTGRDAALQLPNWIRQRSVSWLAASVLFVGGVACVALSAVDAAEPERASTSRATRTEALHAIPLDKLPPEARGKVTAVLNETSLFRRLPIQVVDCEPEMFQYLETNPDVVVNIWQLMGVTNVKLDRTTGNQYRCSDGDGTTAVAEIIYKDADTEIIYASGLYEGPLFPKAVRGQCVAVIKTASQRDTNGRYYVTARLDTFLHVDNVGVEFLAKVFQGIVGRTIDHNFEETVAFIGSVSRTAETNPEGMQRLAAKLRTIEPERRDEFVTASFRVANKLGGSGSTDDSGNATLTGMVQSASEPQRLPTNSRR